MESHFADVARVVRKVVSQSATGATQAAPAPVYEAMPCRVVYTNQMERVSGGKLAVVAMPRALYDATRYVLTSDDELTVNGQVFLVNAIRDARRQGSDAVLGRAELTKVGA